MELDDHGTGVAGRSQGAVDPTTSLREPTIPEILEGVRFGGTPKSHKTPKISNF